MLRLAVLSLLAIGIGAAGAPTARAAQDSGDRLVVRFAASASAGERTAARRQAGARTLHSVPALAGVQVVRVPDGQAARATDVLERSDDVLWAGLDRRVRISTALPADDGSRTGDQWGLLNVGQSIFGRPGVAGIDGGFARAWDTTEGDRSQPIAVVDTGVDFSLADLAANAAAGDHDFIDGDDDATPGPTGARLPSVASHGTHVAGIAAAALAVNQPSGDIAGGAPGAGITALRALDADGHGWSSDIAAAFAWAADHGARVVNASLSGIGRDPAMADAIASHPQTLFVVAAGNGDANGVGYDEDARATDDRDYPCADPSPNVVCVAAIDNGGALAGFSNYGATSVDIAAPGVDVLSYVRGGALRYWDGTSMATPYAAAAAALAFAAQPGASAAQVRAAMLAGASPLTSLAGRTVAGGMVDAAALLRELGSHPAPTLRTPVALPADSPTVGRPLTADGGSFDEGAVNWSWERCDAAGRGCAIVTGAMSRSYTPAAGDVGRRLRVTAAATTPGGTVASASAPSAQVVNSAAAPATTPAAPALSGPPAPAPPRAIWATVSHRWSTRNGRFQLLRLRLGGLPGSAALTIACNGRRCPLSSRRVTARGSSIDLLRALGKRRSFRAGQTLEIHVSAAGHRTEVIRFVLRRGQRPRATSTATGR